MLWKRVILRGWSQLRAAIGSKLFLRKDMRPHLVKKAMVNASRGGRIVPEEIWTSKVENLQPTSEVASWKLPNLASENSSRFLNPHRINLNSRRFLILSTTRDSKEWEIKRKRKSRIIGLFKFMLTKDQLATFLRLKVKPRKATINQNIKYLIQENSQLWLMWIIILAVRDTTIPLRTRKVGMIL